MAWRNLLHDEAQELLSPAAAAAAAALAAVAVSSDAVVDTPVGVCPDPHTATGMQMGPNNRSNVMRARAEVSAAKRSKRYGFIGMQEVARDDEHKVRGKKK